MLRSWLRRTAASRRRSCVYLGFFQLVHTPAAALKLYRSLVAGLVTRRSSPPRTERALLFQSIFYVFLR